MEAVSGREDRAGKVRKVRTVRIMLGLKTESSVPGITGALFPEPSGIFMDVVAGIELHSRLSRPALHGDPADFSPCAGSEPELMRRPVYNVIMVISACHAEDIIGIHQALADEFFLTEIHQSPFHRQDPACGKQFRIRFRIEVRIDPKPVSQNNPEAVQIEITVIGQIEYGILIRYGIINDMQTAFGVQFVCT